MAVSSQKFIPILNTLTEYSSDSFRNDAMAGITVALLAIPQCMAYAVIAEVPPVYGLYAGIVGVLIGSALGSSRMMITGPTANLSLVVGGILVGVSNGTHNLIQIAITISLMVGFLQLAFAVLKIGNLARFVSNAVMTGFIMGGGTVIIGDQLMKLFHVGDTKSPFFINRVYEAGKVMFRGSYELPLVSLLLGSGTIVCLFLLKTIHERIPAGIITVVLGGVVVILLGLEQQDLHMIKRIKNIVPTFQQPSLSPNTWMDLFPGALAVTILATVQSISISKSIASKTQDSIDVNQDLIGQGAANIACGLFSGFPVTGSLSRSFFNHSAGARTRMAGVFCSISMLLLLLFASPLAPYVPMAVLYGLIVYVIGTVFSWEEIKLALATTTRDQVAFICTFLSVLVLKLDWAIYVGVAVSLVLYIRKATRLDLKEYIVDKSGQLKQITDYKERVEEAIALIDVNGETFFGSAGQIKERIQKICDESDKIKVIILRMKNALNLDITGAMVLKEIAQELKEQDRTLMICGATPQIREVLKQAEVAEVIGEDKILVAQKSLLVSSRQAIDRAQAHIDAVLEGKKSREGEQPPLKHTMEHLEDEIDEKGEELDNSVEDPIKEEKVQPPTPEEIQTSNEEEKNEEADEEH